jgi:ABC-2 type transport system permease protein/bacitracin transport system permease protein
MLTTISAELQKLKRNKLVWGILAFNTLLGVYAVDRACSIARSSPYMDSFGDLYTMAFKNLTILFLPIVLGLFATTLFFDEHKNDTLKELLIVPVSKAQLYFSKLAVVFLMSLGLCVYTFIFTVIGGVVGGGFPDLNAHTLTQAATLFIAGGTLIPIAMLPVVFLATLSKGYILPIGATLIYLIPVVIAPSALVGIHPLASAMGIYINVSPASMQMMVNMQGTATGMSPVLSFISLMVIGIIFAISSVIALKKHSY